MSFKVYDYRCEACGSFEEDKFVRASEADDQTCLCGAKLTKLVCAPRLDIAGMAAAGCPGAYETVGNQLEKRHRSVDQHHRKASR